MSTDSLYVICVHLPVIRTVVGSLTVYMDIISFMIGPIADNCTVLTITHTVMSCLPVNRFSILIVTVTVSFPNFS